MLSSDLRNLALDLIERKDPHGQLVLSAKNTKTVFQILDECINQARHLEAFRVQHGPGPIDLSDPKIERFPIERRTIPISTPEGGDAA